MRFGVSLLSLRPGKVGGAETYVRQLVRWLPAVASGDALTLILTRELAGALEAPGWSKAIVDLGDKALIAARIAEASTPWRARAIERRFEGLDAVLFPQQSIFPKRVSAPAVVTVVDLQHLLCPANIALFDRAFRASIYAHSLERARRVIAISAFTARTLVGNAVPAGKIAVVPFGVAPREGAAPEPLEDMPGPYLYYPAATFPHKNHAALFRTYAALVKSGALAEPLVLTGLRTAHWGGLRRLIRKLGMEGRIRHLGYVPYRSLPRIYAGASAVLFPTRFEGFGLPVLEAVELGKKTIVSRLEVFDEIGVPASHQIDFSDPDQLLRALSLPGPTRLTRKPLSWEETAEKTLAELRRVARPAE